MNTKGEFFDEWYKKVKHNHGSYDAYNAGFEKAKELMEQEIKSVDLGDGDYILDFVRNLGQEDE